jgi:hypothetical protein
MKIIRKPKTVRADSIKAGKTFKYTGSDDYDTSCDYIVMSRNSNFRILKGCGMERVDDRVLVYNVNCACFGILKNDDMVTPTKAKMVISA